MRQKYPNTLVKYMYRDGGNYKFYGSSTLVGGAELEDVAGYLIEGEFFIPEHVGLLSLRPKTRNEDDHMLHEFLSFEATSNEADFVTPARIFLGLMKWNKENNALWA